MEKIDLILWFMGAGFSVNFTLLLMMWNSLTSTKEYLEKKINVSEEKLSKKIDDIEDKLSKKIIEVDLKLSQKIDKLDEKVTDIDRRICRLEGAFSAKECCMIKNDQDLKKAE